MAWTSLMSPMSPRQIISQAMRVSSAEYPWLPICVGTLYFRAAAATRRASHTVWVSGLWQWTPSRRSMVNNETVACM